MNLEHLAQQWSHYCLTSLPKFQALVETKFQALLEKLRENVVLWLTVQTGQGSILGMAAAWWAMNDEPG